MQRGARSEIHVGSVWEARQEKLIYKQIYKIDVLFFMGGGGREENRPLMIHRAG